MCMLPLAFELDSSEKTMKIQLVELLKAWGVD